MKPSAASLLLVTLSTLLGCREVPGSCSDDAGHLCVQAEVAAGLPSPDALTLRASADSGEMLAEMDLPGVAAAFASRGHYVVEIDVSKLAEASRINVLLTARRSGGLFAAGTGAASRRDRVRPLVVTLRPASADSDLRTPEPDLSGADLRGADLRPSDDMQAPDLAPPFPSGLSAEFTLGAGVLKAPTDVCYSGSRLYVSDTGNHRVLVYTSVAAGATPMFAVGRSDLVASSVPISPPSAQSMNSPRGLWCDNSFLLVADSANNRVLFFSTPPGTNAAADGVAGQANFSSPAANRGGAVGPSGLFNPRGVFWDGARLFIADRNNNRVVVYSAPNKTALQTLASAGAVSVLGQPNLASSTAGTGASGMSGPEGVFASPTRVAVAEVDNNRVTVFPLPTGVTASADAAFGQLNLANTNPRFGADGLSGPSVVRALGPLVYIADRLFNRALIYDTGLLGAGAFAPAAVAVQGQMNFTDVTAGAGPAQLSRPGGAAFVPDAGGNLLVVADEANNRVQVFRKRD